jgi:orotate phosphoribosyltransferase-like protein
MSTLNRDLRLKVYELRSRGMPKAEIARIVGRSRERVRQLLLEASPFACDLRKPKIIHLRGQNTLDKRNR